MAKKIEGQLTLGEMVKNIKVGDLKNVYLFYGEEEYLKSFFAATICDRYEADRDNIIYFDGKVSATDIEAASESSPLMMTNTVVVVRDSGIFKKADESADNFAFLGELPEESCVIFKEQSVDARNAVFKLVAKSGIAYNCTKQPESEIVKILVHEASINKRNITQGAISLLFNGVGNDILLLNNEVDKLCMLVEEGETIDESHVKYASEISIEAKIFDLTDGIAEKNREKALRQLEALISEKTPSQVILATVATSFMKLDKVFDLKAQGKNVREISEKTGIPEYPVKKYISQSRGYTKNTLKRAIDLISDIDIKGKNGQIDPLTGLEILIHEIAEI